MQARRLEILPSFEAAVEDLAPDVRLRVAEALMHFTDHSADNSLRPELKNGFDNVWSIRITKGYRAFYKKLRDSEGAIYLMFHVGHHDDYRALKKLASRVSVSISTTSKAGVQVSVQTGRGRARQERKH